MSKRKHGRQQLEHERHAGAGSACRTCPHTRIYRSRSSDPIQWLSTSSIST